MIGVGFTLEVRMPITGILVAVGGASRGAKLCATNRGPAQLT